MAGTLLVAATGGHLEQLFRISRRLTPRIEEFEWVTHHDQQSTSLLAGHRVHTIPYIPPRGVKEAVSTMGRARTILAAGEFERVVSTGAGIAVPFFCVARSRGIPCHYIESAARADGPSLTGRIVSRMPGVRLYSQYSSWASGRWNYRGSLFDAFNARETPDRPIRKVVVTLGTMRTYAFRRLLDRLLTVLPEVLEEDADVLWQVGSTDDSGLSGVVRPNVPNAELRQAMSEADLVIAHAGIGSAITALELGQRPMLVPRRLHHHEHVDDHQTLIARELAQRDLVVSRDASEITAEDLRRCARGRVTLSGDPIDFDLVH